MYCQDEMPILIREYNTMYSNQIKSGPLVVLDDVKKYNVFEFFFQLIDSNSFLFEWWICQDTINTFCFQNNKKYQNMKKVWR